MQGLEKQVGLRPIFCQVTALVYPSYSTMSGMGYTMYERDWQHEERDNVRAPQTRPVFPRPR